MSQPVFKVFEDASQPVLAVNPRGKVAFANRLAAELLGYSVSELEGLAVESLMRERLRKSHRALRKGFHKTPRVREMGDGLELSILTRDGREIPVEIGLRPFEDTDCIVAVIRDISASHRLIEDVRVSEARFRAAAEATLDLIWEADPDDGSVIWHGDVDGALGYSPRESPRTNAEWAELIHPDDRDEVHRSIADCREIGDRLTLRYRIRHQDGTYRHWEDRATVVQVEGTRKKQVVGCVRDITERILSQEALEGALRAAKEQGELNQSILSSFPSHVALLNGDGEIVAVNTAWTEFAESNGNGSGACLGVGADYLQVCADASENEADAKVAFEGISAILNGSRDRFTMEYPCHGPDEERWFWMAVNSSAGPGGGVVMVHVDATERILAREERERTLQEVARLKEQLEGEHQYLQEEIKSDHNFGEIIGESSAMTSMLETIGQVAGTDATVLLLGETGTGKELAARAVHSGSRRRDRALIKVDCASIPSGLVESELFGHMRGSFTGAHESRPGRFELADEGTIFLDEIGELSPDLQAKLLRVLQDGELQRLGSRDVKSIDVRVIAATNRDLKLEVDEGRFRADLYYRLNVFPIQLPALRHRREDIPLLTAYFVSTCSTQIGRRIDEISADTQQELNRYDWPGNVRELRNVIERAIIVSAGGVLKLPDRLSGPQSTPESESPSLRRDLEEIERQNIIIALEESHWKIKGDDNAASRLGLSPSTLRSRMKRLGIERRV